YLRGSGGSDAAGDLGAGGGGGGNGNGAGRAVPAEITHCLQAPQGASPRGACDPGPAGAMETVPARGRAVEGCRRLGGTLSRQLGGAYGPTRRLSAAIKRQGATS